MSASTRARRIAGTFAVMAAMAWGGGVGPAVGASAQSDIALQEVSGGRGMASLFCIGCLTSLFVAGGGSPFNMALAALLMPEFTGACTIICYQAVS